MKVNVISYEPKNGWILYDYAAKLNDSLRKIGVHSELTFEQHKGFDVTFHVNYWGLKDVLSEKYKFSHEDALQVSDFLLGILEV